MIPYSTTGPTMNGAATGKTASRRALDNAWSWALLAEESPLGRERDDAARMSTMWAAIARAERGSNA